MTQRMPNLPYMDEDSDLDEYDERGGLEELDEYDEEGDIEELDYNEEEV